MSSRQAPYRLPVLRFWSLSVNGFAVPNAEDILRVKGDRRAARELTASAGPATLNRSFDCATTMTTGRATSSAARSPGGHLDGMYAVIWPFLIIAYCDQDGTGRIVVLGI